MARLSILVRAMRAQAQDVLHEELVVGGIGHRLAARELQAHAAELRRAPIHHRGPLAGTEGIGRAGIEVVVAHAHAPQRDRLVDGLEVPAALRERIGRGIDGDGTVDGRLALLLAAEVFALHLEIRLARIAVGRPLPYEVDDAGVVLRAALVAFRAQPRYARAPAVARAHVAAPMSVERARSDAVRVAIGSGERLPAARFGAELEILLDGRDPFHLHAVVAVLPAQECLV